jgi:hypothetical protein
MIGKKFGKWTVLEEIVTERPGRYYKCRCDCGNERDIQGVTLRANRSKQCTDCQYATLYNPDKEIGKSYGKWTIIKFIDIHRKLMRFEARCECGTLGIHAAADLRSGKSKQCTTCHNRENARNNTRHGMHRTLLYKTWSAMLDRCRREASTTYKYYGGRGIKVCDRWYKFENFYADMGERPKGLQLDRRDNMGDYEPGNCQWVTPKENSNNRRPGPKFRNTKRRTALEAYNMSISFKTYWLPGKRAIMRK